MSERLGFLLHGFGDVGDVEGELALAEFGGVEGFQAVVVEGGVLLGEAEGLVGSAVLVDVAEVGLAVKTIVAL